MTPDSFGSNEAKHSPTLAQSESDSRFARTYVLGIGNNAEVYTPHPRRASQIPPSVPQWCLYNVHHDDQMLAGEIINQTMGFSSPSTFGIPTPTETFQNLMGRPVEGSIFC